MRPRNIVIGTAGLDEADPHLPEAVRTAEALGAVLHVVHGFHLPLPLLNPYSELGSLSDAAGDRLQRHTQHRVDSLVKGLSSRVPVRGWALAASADRAVLRVADEVHADLVLVGATRRGKLARAILGTTAQRVLRSARAPVLVMGSRRHGPPRRVLLTGDLSELSQSVHERALGLVRQLGVAPDLQVQSLLVLAYDLPIPPPLRQNVLSEVAQGQIEEFLERLPTRAIPVEAHVRLGEPAKEIVDEASRWDADLLVLGTHGRTGTSRLLIGSVAEAVLRSARCDVLVVPTAALAAADAYGDARISRTTRGGGDEQIAGWDQLRGVQAAFGETPDGGRESPGVLPRL